MKKRGFVVRILVFLLVSLSSFVSFSAAGNDDVDTSSVRYSPATFGDDGKALSAKLFLPKRVDGVDQTVYCTGVVSIRGRIEEQLCNWGFDNRQYRPTMVQAAKGVRLNPALVDGERVVAYIKYSLRVTHEDGKPNLEIFPHHFANEQYYGDDYIAAQSYSKGTNLDSTGSHFFGKPWIQKSVPSRCIRSSRVFLLFKVNRQGLLEDIQATDESRPKRCIEPITKAAESGLYIPAFHEGKPVESVYIEKYYSDSKVSNTDFSRTL